MTVPLANHHWDTGGHEPDRRGMARSDIADVYHLPI